MRSRRDPCNCANSDGGMRRVLSIVSDAAAIAAPSSRALASGSWRLWLSMRDPVVDTPLRPRCPALSMGAEPSGLNLASVRRPQRRRGCQSGACLTGDRDFQALDPDLLGEAGL